MEKIDKVKNIIIFVIKTIYIYLINIDYQKYISILKYKFIIFKNKLYNSLKSINENKKEVSFLKSEINTLKNESNEEINFLKSEINILKNKNILLEEEKQKIFKNNTSYKNILWGFYDIISSISEKDIIELSENTSIMLNSLGKGIIYLDSYNENKISLENFNENIENLNLVDFLTNKSTIDEIIQLSKFLIITNNLIESNILLEEYKLIKNI